MFLDLGIAWDARRAAAMAELALRYGFAGVAHTVTVAGPQVMDLHSHRCAVAPCALSVAPDCCGPLRSNLAADLGLPSEGPLLQLRRLTLAVSSSSQLSAANGAVRLKPAYDLIALRPMNGESMQAACEQGDCDIISLPLDEKLFFTLKHKEIHTFLQRGGFFEIELSPALRDSGRRRCLLQNAAQLLHATRGKNVFLSSAAGEPMEMRSPHDLASFATVLGLRGPMALRSVREVPYRVLQRATARRGSAQVVELPRPVTSDASCDVEMEEARPPERPVGSAVQRLRRLGVKRVQAQA